MDSAGRPHLDLTARCACGAVAVSVNGRALSMLLCSCTDCQKATGTGHSAVVSVEAADVAITGPTTAFARPADSGATFTRHFCPRCGTPVYGVSSRAERLILIPAGLFEGQNDWFAPSQLIFARSHLDWDTIGAGLPQHLAYRLRGAAQSAGDGP